MDGSGLSDEEMQAFARWTNLSETTFLLPPSPGLLAQVAHALGLTAKQIISAQHLSNGTDWLGVLVDDMQSVLQLQPDHPALKNLGVKVGVAAVDAARAAPDSIANKLEVRAFAALNGINEDPVTGSLNASLAQWLIADEYMPASYVVHQGTCIQREGRIHIRQDANGQVWVGGDSVTCIRGSATL